MINYFLKREPTMRKKKIEYNSRQWLQGGARNTAFIQTSFSEPKNGGWFDASLKISDCNRIVTIHPLGADTNKDKQIFIKKLRVITSEIDKLVKNIEGSLE